MNINATLFVQLVVFFIGAWVTMKFIWPPLLKSLEDRQKKIADGLAAADRGQKSLEDAKRKIAEEQAAERAHVQQLITEAEKRGQAIVDAAKDQAKVEADRIVEAAKAEATQEMQRAKDALRDQVAVLAVAGAEQILKREVNPQVHSELLAQLKAKL
ncbi:MAG: F0F1 ATP synthase subunit B [Burkholderiaceae bacterium]|jgi:F-type H+-transporting ATPase subunit b|nr:F0F1 ATP synthase subunit B [Burkholderiaceae bacterium]MDH5207366.1 F0F1 ATP synthase subunit B [Burkholderiaceae bacterium]